MPQGKSVLVVDDSRQQRTLLRELLSEANPGGRFFALENGEQAVEHLARVAAGDAPSVDLVLVDREMPRLDGFETTRRVRQLVPFADLALIVVSGSDFDGHIQEAREAGASDYRVKPPTLEEWDAWARDVSVWTPAASRWADQKIVLRESRGKEIVAARPVDTLVPGMEREQAGPYPGGHLNYAAQKAELPLAFALDTRIKDHGVALKRRNFVRVLFRLGWTKPELMLHIPGISERWLEDQQGKPLLESCGNRALVLK